MINSVVIMGRLTAAPELKRTPNNIAVTSFTVAIDRGYVKSGAEKQTDFIDVVAWRNTAEFITKYFGKGSMIAIQGSVQTRSYTDSQGARRKAVEVLAGNVSFTGEKRDYGNGPGSYAPSTLDIANDFVEIGEDDNLPF